MGIINLKQNDDEKKTTITRNDFAADGDKCP